MKSKNFQDNEISGLVPEAGAIFMSNCATLKECFERKLFGLPSSYADFVSEVKTGMILFLFEYENRKLYGVFEASSDGEMNIVPHAFSSTGKKYPAQVRFNTIRPCHPLNENEFYDSIKENYFTRNKFHFGLSGDQITGLLELFNVRNVEVAEVQDTTCTKKRCNKHSSGNEKMEKGRPRSRRKPSHGNSQLIGIQPRSTPCNDTDNYEAFVTPSSMVLGTGCSSLGHESVMSSFGWGRQPSMSKVEPEKLNPSFEDPRDFIPLSLSGSVSNHNGPVKYIEEPENLKLPTQDLRTNLGDFMPLSSLTASEPNMYREEPENLKHPSQDLRTNHGDFMPLSLTANEPSMHNNLNHPSRGLRTNLGDFMPLSFTANEPSLYRREVENLKHPSLDLRTNLGDFMPLSFTANEPSLYKQEAENFKHPSQYLRTNLGDFMPLSFTANEPSLYRQEAENLKHPSQHHRTYLGDFIPLLFTANEPSLYREEPENLKQSSQNLRTDLRDFIPVSFSDNVSDYNGNTSGDSVTKERVGVFARLGKVSESDKRDNSVFTRLQWGNTKRKKIINAKSTVQAKKNNSQGEISVETSSNTLQENDQRKTLIREPVVSTWNHDKFHFKKSQMGKMLKERELTEERDSADNHWKALIREPVASVENRKYEDNFRKGTQRGPTEEIESVDGSKRKLEHRPRRKLIRPSFHKSSEVKHSCPYSSFNDQLCCQESSVGNANNEQCAETSKSNRTDGEEDFPPVISPSHCKGDNLTDHDSKFGDVFGENSGAGTVSKPLKTYQRRPK